MFCRLRRPVQSSRDRIDKLRDMIGNDRFGRGYVLSAQFERLLRNRAYGIDVVKINAFQFIYAWVDVPRRADDPPAAATSELVPRMSATVPQMLLT